MRIRGPAAGLAGIGAAASLLAITTPSASASTYEAINCTKYGIGTICVVRDLDPDSGRYEFHGEYENTGAGPHSGHIDLYVDSSIANVGVPHERAPGGICDSVSIYVYPGSSKVRADWVDQNGHHFHSPTKAISAGL